MPVLTRKRKAELEAGDPEMQEQLTLEAENATKQRSPKRQKRDKPPKRTDPFRPLVSVPILLISYLSHFQFTVLINIVAVSSSQDSDAPGPPGQVLHAEEEDCSVSAPTAYSLLHRAGNHHGEASIGQKPKQQRSGHYNGHSIFIPI